MGYRIINFFKKHKIIKIIVLMILANVVAMPIISTFCKIIYFREIQSIMTVLLRFAFFIFSLSIAIVYSKFEIYKKHTGGRNLIIDKKIYKRDQIDLMTSLKRDPRQLDVTTMPALPWKYCNGLILGKKDGRTICKKSNADGNAITFAAPGVGKTTGQVIPTALNFRGSVFALDIKGDISAYTSGRRRIKFFNPDDVESCHFDPLFTVRNSDSNNRGLAIENIANILVPVKSKGEGEYFEKGAHDIFCGVVNYHISQNPNITFPQIINSILTSDAISWVKRIKTSKIMEAKIYTDGYFGSNEKNLAGCYGQLTTKLRPLTSLGYLSILLQPNDNEISPEDLESGTDVYLVISEARLTSYSPVITLICDSFMNAFRNREDASSNQRVAPILMLLDEFVQLNFSFESITSALATLRSKSVSIFMICQSLGALRSRYGMQGATTIMDNCRYKSIMSAGDPESQRYFADLIGKQRTLKPIGQSSSEAEEYIVRPEQLSNLGDKVVIIADGKYCIAEKIKCYEDIKPLDEGTIKLRNMK